ncbi:MAG: AMP-binding protein [Hyphomicrobiales bacterium]|nr:AMP-binding protein [Hyphomicrobiales bacterium]
MTAQPRFEGQADGFAVDPAQADAGARSNDLLGFDIVSLTRSAAQLRIDQPAFIQSGLESGALASAGDTSPVSYRAFQGLVGRSASALVNVGLQPGERVLIAGCTSVHAIAMMIGALSAGIDAALAGMHLDGEEIGAFARITGAAAIVTEAGADDPATVSQILTAAAGADCVRLVLSLNRDPADGIVAVAAAAGGKAESPPISSGASILTRNSDGMPVTHSQQTLIVAGLDFIARTNLSAGSSIISTLIPASFAGLVCGPVAGLLLGALTNMHAPFDSRALLRAIEAGKPAQLIAPAALARQIAESGVCDKEHLAALVLLKRYEAAPSTLEPSGLPPLSVTGIAISDAAAFDEIAVAAQLRGTDGVPVKPLEQNHMIHIDGREVLAVRAVKHLLENNGVRSTAMTFDGAAVSKLDWKYYDTAD